MKELWKVFKESLAPTCLVLLAGVFFMYLLGIGIKEAVKQDNSRKLNQGAYYKNGTWIYVIDGCEYLKGQNYTHKENCTNLIHKTK